MELFIMTKEDFEKLMYAVIDGRDDMNLEFSTSGYVHLYANSNRFTATFICHVIEIASDCFIGVCVDSNDRPYLLFAD